MNANTDTRTAPTPRTLIQQKEPTRTTLTPLAPAPQTRPPQQTTSLPRWSRLLAGAAMAVTLFVSAPLVQAEDSIITLEEIQVRGELDAVVREQRDRAERLGILRLAAESPELGDINCDEGDDGGCHFKLCCDTSTGECAQSVECLKAPE